MILSSGGLHPDPGLDCPQCTGSEDQHDVTCPRTAGVEARCRGCQSGLGYAVTRGAREPDSCYRCRGAWPDEGTPDDWGAF